MDDIIDFNDCPYSIRNATYGGHAGRKDGVIYNGSMWMLKYPKSTKDMSGEYLLSYASSPLSEYIGSHVYEILGFDVHETVLGTKNGKLIVGCKDFVEQGEALVEMRTIVNYAGKELADEIDGSGSFSSDAVPDVDLICLHLDKNPVLAIPGMKEHFWDMVIVDAYINNNDRNFGNWGLIRDRNGHDRISPVYDNGASFNNKLSDEELGRQLLGKDFESRSYNVMSSYYREGKRLYIGEMFQIPDDVFEKEIKKIVPLIEEKHSEICRMINNLPKEINGISIIGENKKKHFVGGLSARLEKILMPALEQL